MVFFIICVKLFDNILWLISSIHGLNICYLILIVNVCLYINRLEIFEILLVSLIAFLLHLTKSIIRML